MQITKFEKETTVIVNDNRLHGPTHVQNLRIDERLSVKTKRESIFIKLI